MGMIIYEYKNRFHYLHVIVSLIVLQMRMYVEPSHYFRHQINMFRSVCGYTLRELPCRDNYIILC